MGNGIVSPKSVTLVPDATGADNDSIAATQTLGGAANMTLAGTASSFAPAGIGLFVMKQEHGTLHLKWVAQQTLLQVHLHLQHNN